MGVEVQGVGICQGAVSCLHVHGLQLDLREVWTCLSVRVDDLLELLAVLFQGFHLVAEVAVVLDDLLKVLKCEKY